MFIVLRVIGRLIPSGLSSAFNDSATPYVDKLHGGRVRRSFDNVRAIDVPPCAVVVFFRSTARLEFPEPYARPSHRRAAIVFLFDRGWDDRRRWCRTKQSTGHVQERHCLRDRQCEQAGRGQANIQELLQRLSGPVQREYTTDGGLGRSDVVNGLWCDRARSLDHLKPR